MNIKRLEQKIQTITKDDHFKIRLGQEYDAVSIALQTIIDNIAKLNDAIGSMEFVKKYYSDLFDTRHKYMNFITNYEDGTKRIVGVKNTKKSYEEVANRIKTRIEPSIIPTIDIVNIQGKDLIVVKVIPGQHTPYYYVNKGTRIAYIRKGDQDCETNSTELNELILRGRNQLVCDIFSRLDFMERRGSGIKKIFQAYENDEKKPKFEIIDDVFIVTFYSRLYRDISKNVDVIGKNVDENIENVDVNNKNVDVSIIIKNIKQKYPKLRKNYIDIIEIIYENRNITQEEIALKLGKSKNSIYRNLKVLREIGIVERIGSDKKGNWRINY